MGDALNRLLVSLALVCVTISTVHILPVSSQQGGSGSNSNQPVSISALPGGVEDALHSNPNCSCFDRHQTHILMVVDVLDISYYYSVLVAGAKRAAQDMGAELFIQPSSVFSPTQMSASIVSSLSTPLFAYSQGPPDAIISALPGITTRDEPLATLLNVYQSNHIPFASIHSANINLTLQLGDYDSGFLYHIGADNYLLGQTAANELMNRTVKAGGALAKTAVCFTDMLTNKASIDRCTGFADVFTQNGINTVVFEMNTITQSPITTQNVLTQYQQVGAAIPVLAINAECTGLLLNALTYYDSQSNATRQGIKSGQLVTIAAVDIPPTTAQALQQGVITVAIDQQAFFAGYMSVVIASLYVRTSTYPSQRFYSTGPLVVDANTPQLIQHANAEAAGFPECGAPGSPVTNCFNRSSLFFESSHHLIVSDPFGGNVRSGLYQGTFDMRVQLSDLVQPVKINANNVNQMKNLAASVAAGNMTLSGVIAVPRDPVNSLPYFQQLISMNVPVVSINNAYGIGLAAQWSGPYQPIAHVGTDNRAFGAAIGKRFVTMQACQKMTILDPDGSYSLDPMYQLIAATINAANIVAMIQPATQVNPSVAAQQIQSYYQNGTNCFLLGNQDGLLTILKNLGLLGKPGVYVAVRDYTAYSIALQAQGLLAFTAVQNEYYQGYLPVVLQTVLAMTGGAVRGNRPLLTSYTLESTYGFPYIFPYIETGPQFLTVNTRNIRRIAGCGSGLSGSFSSDVALPAIIPITSYPFAQIEFPVCLDPPAAVSLAVIRSDMFQKMQSYAACMSLAQAASLNSSSATSSSSKCVNPFNATTNPVFNLNYVTEKDTLSLIGSTYNAFSGSTSDFLLAALDFNNQLISANTIKSWAQQSATHAITVYSQIISVTAATSGSSPVKSDATLTVSQLGTTQASLQSSSSVANFSDYTVVSAPGSKVTLRFYMSLPDGRSIYSNIVSMSYQSCNPGYFVSNNLCEACPSGYTSYTVGATACVVVQESVPWAASVAVRVIGGVVLAALLSVMFILIEKRKSRVVLSYSPFFCIISLAGLLMAAVSAILMVDTNAQPSLCTLSTWLFNVGITIAFAAVWAKAFRLWRIFGNPLLQMISITNIQLLLVIAAFTGVDIIVLAVWTGTSPYTVSPADNKYLTCVSTNGDTFDGILIAIKGFWILTGAWLIREIRRLSIPSKYNESEAMSLAIYNVAIIGGAAVGIWFGLRGSIGESSISIILAIAVLLAVSAFAGFLFYPIVKQLYSDKKLPGVKRSGFNTSRSEDKSAVTAATSGTGHSNLVSSYAEIDDRNDPIYSLLTLSEDFERVVQEIKRKPVIHVLEKAILDTYPKVKTNQKKALETIMAFRKDLMQIAKVNAELFFLQGAGRVKPEDLIQQSHSHATSTEIRKPSQGVQHNNKSQRTSVTGILTDTPPMQPVTQLSQVSAGPNDRRRSSGAPILTKSIRLSMDGQDASAVAPMVTVTAISTVNESVAEIEAAPKPFQSEVRRNHV